ncbi:MAG: serine hydrolase [Clostridia bacterium]
MKQTVSLLLIVLMLCFVPIAHADNPTLKETDGLSGAVLMEPTSRTRLWAKDADEKRMVAGLSKLPAILTLAQSVDDGSISEEGKIRVSVRAAGILGPTAFLADGEEISARDLIKAAVMISAGDAIMALGENAYGSESVFVENINVTMHQLGLTTTVNDALGTGLMLTAWELATLGSAAAESTTFTKYCMLYLDAITHSDGRETELVNANRLLKNYAGCKGLLTGSSSTDGYCGVFAAVRNGTNLVAVVIGAENATLRTTAAVTLLDYGFANFRFEILCKAGAPMVKDVPVRDGDIRTVNLVPKETATAIFKTNQGKVTETLSAPEVIEAPVAVDVSVGSMEYRDESGNVIATVPLYVEREIQAYGMKDILLRILSQFINHAK